MDLATKKQIEALADKREERGILVSVAQLRSKTEADKPTQIFGHASVFNTPADLGYFTEKVAPGAFTKTIAQDDVRALFNHNSDLLLGRTTSKTLRMSEDSVGLFFEVDLPDTSLGRDLPVLMNRGDLTQCSIGFYARGVEIAKVDGVWQRTLTDIQLFDVSPVTYPAFVETDCAVRHVRSIEKIFSEFRNGPDPAGDADPEEWKHAFEARRRQLLLAEL